MLFIMMYIIEHRKVFESNWNIFLILEMPNARVNHWNIQTPKKDTCNWLDYQSTLRIKISSHIFQIKDNFGLYLINIYELICVCPETRNAWMISETAYSSQTKLIGQNLHLLEHGIGYSNLAFAVNKGQKQITVECRRSIKFYRLQDGVIFKFCPFLP